METKCEKPTSPPSTIFHMGSKIQHTLLLAVANILRPLIRTLLRHGVSCNDFTALSKRLYIEQAEKSFLLPGKKQSTSRISILTGLNRKEVQRIRALPDVDTAPPQGQSRSSRVINGWLRDSEFIDSTGKPQNLPLEGSNSFSSLVKKYSGDMPVRAMLDELIRSGAVKLMPDGYYELITHAYVPHQCEQEKLKIMGNAGADLLGTLDHNLDTSKQNHLQLTLAYNNLPLEALAPFKELSKKEVNTLLRKLNKELSLQDRDINPKINGTGHYRAGIGVYYFEEPSGGKIDE